MGCGCNKSGGSKSKSSMRKVSVKKTGAGHKSVMPKKMSIICERAGTTNPDIVQRH